MKLLERRQRLDALLLACRDVWHAQPFREQYPGWCDSRPDLHAELLALPEAAVARLNDDSGAALDLLGRYLPEVAELAVLSDIPACPETRLADHGSRWAWEIPGRKQQQIEAFARAVRPEGRSVIDWCGGKGHLGRLLALEWALPVHTLEIDAALCADGEGLAGKLAVDQHFWSRDALTVTDWPQVGQHAVALHACGELHRRLIQHGAQVGARRFDVAPCCYYRGVETAYRPLDQNGVTLQLTRDDTRLAVTEMVTASPRQARQRDRDMAWKLAFAHWRQMVSGVAYQSFKSVPPAWLRGGFGDFLARMCQREGLPVAAERCLVEIETAGWQRQREVMRLSIARHAFRRALEIWLVLDLACYLERGGYAVDLGVFCQRELTPRNLLISARRSD